VKERAGRVGAGVDVILEMLANANLQKDFGALAMRGASRSSATAAASRSTRGSP